MDIDSDTLGIPDTDYDARVTMPSAEFARIVRDLSTLGESVRIEVTKEGIRFVSEGEAANGNVLLKHNESVGPEKKKGSSSKSKGKKDPKAPKRALSAYMFFSQDWRERIKAENPDAGFGELGLVFIGRDGDGS